MNPLTATSQPAAPVNERPGTMSAERQELVTKNIALVSHIVHETMARVPSHVSREDLTSAGLMALTQAAIAFEPSREIPFTRYAATRVRGAILDELRSVDWASRSVRRRSRDIEAARATLAQTLGRVPTNEELANALGLSVDDLNRNEDDRNRAQVLSLQGAADVDLDELLPSGGPTPEQLVEHREQLTYMVEAVAELPERLRIVIQDYFLGERPMADIAAELGVSESRVSQMRGEALALLRGALTRALSPSAAPPEQTGGGCAARRREAYYAAVADRHAARLTRTVTTPRLSSTA